MATEEWVNLAGGFARRGMGRSPDGKLARYECGNTDHLGPDRPTFLSKEKKWKTKPKGVRIQKGEK